LFIHHTKEALQALFAKERDGRILLDIRRNVSIGRKDGQKPIQYRNILVG
jgi:hypothetical protein